MKYYKLLYDYEHDNDYVFCNKMDIGNLDRYIESSGCEFTPSKRITMYLDGEDGSVFTDYLANEYCWFVISERLKALIEGLPDYRIQFIPVDLIDSFGNIMTNKYYVCNILDVIDAIDLENSVYNVFSTMGETVYSFVKYALKAEMTKDKHIFRIKSCTIPIFVSEYFKQIIENNSMTGFDFLEVKLT